MPTIGSTPDLTREFSSVQDIKGIRADLRILVAAGGDPELTYSTLLAASELLTNCVIHTEEAGRVAAWLHLTPLRVRVEVDDRNTNQLIVSHVGPLGASGRGLQLVAAVATAWGVAGHADGKTVWFEILSQQTPAASPHPPALRDVRCGPGATSARRDLNRDRIESTGQRGTPHDRLCVPGQPGRVPCECAATSQTQRRSSAQNRAPYPGSGRHGRPRPLSSS
jgi:hypothetical protein